ncbi:MAG TPA: prephenate dehydrogenase/arogenate dehydrogenase family protein, partial [Terriglobales bacterium]|nr:prephenate dehydrogenase/arogenate dehydrogenase family protein [Terriglobales bacterium]
MARERVGILGLGLIGGSLALALKGKRGAPEVWGCDLRKESVRRALSAGAISRGCTDAQLAACDMVIVCVPVLRAVEAIRRIGPRMRPGTILTDAGSVKSGIVREGERAVAKG